MNVFLSGTARGVVWLFISECSRTHNSWGLWAMLIHWCGMDLFQQFLHCVSSVQLVLPVHWWGAGCEESGSWAHLLCSEMISRLQGDEGIPTNWIFMAPCLSAVQQMCWCLFIARGPPATITHTYRALHSEKHPTMSVPLWNNKPKHTAQTHTHTHTFTWMGKCFKLSWSIQRRTEGSSCCVRLKRTKNTER